MVYLSFLRQAQNCFHCDALQQLKMNAGAGSDRTSSDLIEAGYLSTADLETLSIYNCRNCELELIGAFGGGKPHRSQPDNGG
jgi:hypothetical protein